jgi:hypothetical protein
MQELKISDKIGATLQKRVRSPRISQVRQRENKWLKLALLGEATNSAAWQANM